MTISSSRASLSRHLGRLRQGLDGLGEQLREAVARAVGRSAGDAVGEAVHAALGGPDAPPRPAAGPAYGSMTRRPSRSWEADDPSWWREAEEVGPDGQPAGDDFGDRRYFAPYPGRDEPPAQEGQHSGRWARVVAAGLQAAAWWVRRHPGRASLLAALAVGAAAGLLSLLGHAAGAAGLVASALGLACLADLARSLGALLGAGPDI